MIASSDSTIRRLSLGRGLAYASGNLVVGGLPSTIGAFLLYFWIQTDESKTVAFLLFGVYSAVQMFGRIQDAVADPIVGYLSDRWNTRFGRRLPWIVGGAPLLLGSFIALWYPPSASPDSTMNVVYLAFVLGAFWWGFTLVVAPYLSLLPEICPDLDQRIRISQWMAYFEVAGTLLGMVAAGFIIDGANSALPGSFYPGGRYEWGLFHPHGYHVMAWSVSGLCALALLPVVLFVRETGAPEAKAVPFRFLEAAKTCLKNRAFLLYVLSTAFFRLGFLMVVASVVFFARTVLHQTEALAGALSGVTLVISFLFFYPVDALARRFGKKRVYLWGLLGFALLLPLLTTVIHAPVFGQLFGPGIGRLLGAEGAPDDLVRVTHALFAFVLISPPVAVIFVLPRPIIADVMDLDHRETGYRRECMYNGMEAVFTKTASGLSVVLLNLLAWFDPASQAGSDQSMTLGIGALSAVGPVAGAIVFVGWLLMRKYPIER